MPEVCSGLKQPKKSSVLVFLCTPGSELDLLWALLCAMEQGVEVRTDQSWLQVWLQPLVMARCALARTLTPQHSCWCEQFLYKIRTAATDSLLTPKLFRNIILSIR